MASSFAAGAGADMLQKILVQKALESMQRQKLAEDARQADMLQQTQQGQLDIGRQNVDLRRREYEQSLQPKPEAAPKPIVVGGRIIDPTTFKPLYEPPEKPSAPVRPISVAPGGTLFDPTTNKTIFHAPDRPTGGGAGARGAGQQAPGSNPAADYGEERSLRMRDMINDILPNISRMTVGIGSTMAAVPETPARNMRAKLEALKANVGFKELQEMRNASKTGGALGQVSDRENALLGAALGSLDQGQSPAQMTATLKKIQGSLDRWEAAKVKYGGGNTPAAASGARPTAADLIKKYGGQ